MKNLNELLTREEYNNLLKDECFVPASSPSKFFDDISPLREILGFYNGRRVYLRDDGMVLLFEACEWCRSNEPLDKYGNCSKCGGYPTSNTFST